MFEEENAIRRESCRLNLSKDENSIKANQSMNCITADEFPLGEAGKAASNGRKVKALLINRFLH